MLVLAVIIAADMSIMLPRSKPEIPPPVASAPAETVIATSPPVVIVQQPTPAERQAARLKKLEMELRSNRVQQVRIEQKLDVFLKREEAKDAGGVR